MSICRACGADNLDANRFCGTCGTPLGEAEVLQRQIDTSVERALAARMKERDVVETQLANAVLAKLLAWGKVYGSLLAVLIALAAFVLARLGIDSYQSLKRKVDETAATVEPKLAAARAAATRAQKETQDLEAELTKRRAQLDAIPQVVERISALEKVTFEKSPGVSDDVTKFLQSSLDGFARYLDRVGFPKRDHVSVLVDAKSESRSNAYYEPEKKRITVGANIASDPDAIYHEFTQYALGAITTEKYAPEYLGLVYGLSDYYPCSYRDDPILAPIMAAVLGKEPGVGLRNLKHQRRFLVRIDENTELHDLGEIWAGAFWDLRGRIGQPTTDRLLLRAWQRLSPGQGKVAEYVAALMAVDQAEFSGEHVQVIRDVFTRRGARLS